MSGASECFTRSRSGASMLQNNVILEDSIIRSILEETDSITPITPITDNWYFIVVAPTTVISHVNKNLVWFLDPHKIKLPFADEVTLAFARVHGGSWSYEEGCRHLQPIDLVFLDLVLHFHLQDLDARTRFWSWVPRSRESILVVLLLVLRSQFWVLRFGFDSFAECL